MDLITFGEALIDLPSTQNGVSLAEAPGFLKVPAGAPANVAVAAARLGLQSAFITKVGEDAFGEAILSTFQRRGVDISRARTDPQAHTGLAFVSLREDGERDFLFYFDPARDLALHSDELDLPFLRSARAFHYGSISLIAEPCRTTTLAAARIARESGALISYDPNLRPRLWPNEEIMRTIAWAGFAEAQIAKVSREELFLLVPNPAKESAAARSLLESFPTLKLLCVSDGERGSAAYWRSADNQDCAAHVPGFSVKAIDATGAGDAFVAGLIAFLLRKSPRDQELLAGIAGHLEECLAYANACGALAATERGAAMEHVDHEAVLQLIASRE